MTQKKKKLSDDQCALRKLVAQEVGMTKEDMRLEIMTAIQTIVNQKTKDIDIGCMIRNAVAAATGTPVALRNRVERSITARLRTYVEREVMRQFKMPDSIKVDIPLTPKRNQSKGDK